MKHLILITLLLATSIGFSMKPEDVNSYKDEPVVQRTLDKKAWKKLTSDLDYPYKEPKKAASVKPRKDSWNPDSSGFWKVLFYALIAALIAIILYWVANAGLGLRSRRIRDITQDLEEALEGDIRESRLEDLLESALREKAYKLAVRIWYLMVIRQLTEREYIDWRKEKTNAQYLREMQSRPEFDPFNKTTRIFEYVWYGDQDITQQDYEGLQPAFAGLLANLKPPADA